jgi:prepilin-type N-terminal cleavage/methylation domain
MRSAGFTLLEVLLSIAILGLVVVASLKLVALSERGLSQVREREALLDEAAKLQVALELDPLNTFGTSEDVSWKVEERTAPLWFDENITLANLGLDDETSRKYTEMLKQQKLRWRELEITKNEKTIVLFAPYSELAARVKSGDTLSDLLSEDKR